MCSASTQRQSKRHTAGTSQTHVGTEQQQRLQVLKRYGQPTPWTGRNGRTAGIGWRSECYFDWNVCPSLPTLCPTPQTLWIVHDAIIVHPAPSGDTNLLLGQGYPSQSQTRETFEFDNGHISTHKPPHPMKPVPIGSCSTRSVMLGRSWAGVRPPTKAMPRCISKQGRALRLL